jgi:prephenate dehydrogenase
MTDQYRSSISSVGILGLGSFGTFVASLIPSHIKVIGYDFNPTIVTATIPHGTFEEVCGADVLILAIPLSAYPETLARLEPILQPGTLMIDVCSVKQKAETLFSAHLSRHPNMLLTHPLFGPQSAGSSTQGHHLIVTKQMGARAQQIVTFCETTLSLVIDRLSSEEHDRVMAQVHALTFFVARTLANMRLGEAPFKTPSYKLITDLIALDKSHSEDLFETIELGNSFAKDVQERFLRSVEQVRKQLAVKEEL